MINLKRPSAILIVLVLFCTIHARLAKQASVDANGAASGSDYSFDSRHAHRDDGGVNLLTGTPQYHVTLLDISCKSGLTYPLDLHYNGAMEGQVMKSDDIAPVGVAGLGWHVSAGAIYVDAKGTADLSDDEYFLKQSNGVVSEIARTGSSQSTYDYQIKNHPYWRVTADYSGANIAGWKVVLADGTTYRYGYDGPANARRNVNVNDDGYLGCGVDVFYYQWDLKQIEDVDGSKITFSYQQVPGTVNGYTYTKESYPQEIKAEDNGDKLEFVLGAKDPKEGRAIPFIGDFDFTPLRIGFSYIVAGVVRSCYSSREQTSQYASGQSKRYFATVQQLPTMRGNSRQIFLYGPHSCCGIWPMMLYSSHGRSIS